MPKKVIRIDASSLKNPCLLAFYNTVVLGIRDPVNKVEVEFGSAVHLFANRMYRTGGDFKVAIGEAVDYFHSTPKYTSKMKSYLDEQHLTLTCIKLWEYLTALGFDVIIGEDGMPATEITFSNRYYETDDYEVRLEGTIDLMGKFGLNGCFAIEDFKTSSSRDQEEFFNGFRLSTQILFYLLNLYLYAEQNPDSLVAKICKNKVGAFIIGIFLNGKDKIEFGKSEIFFPPEERMELYKKLLFARIQRLLVHIIGDNKPEPEGILTDVCSKPENSSNGSWRCRYWKLCAAPDKIAEEHILKRDFITKEYLPLTHGKKK